ncbi:MAG TPA: Holliday junction resolvase RuvX [Actinospica sp.]|jgi:putative Holliday junction resolvase|nr:Holliday junction resolvase RuvX [Actinospica sp.]
MRAGRRLGVDVGAVRVGVAVCDPEGLLATPVETVAAGDGDIARLAELAAEYGVVEAVVGLPRSLSGAEGRAAAKARAFAARLVGKIHPIPVRLVDERLTTVTATRGLRESGVRGRKSRAVVDQAAAVVILQNALDAERISGRAPGTLVDLEHEGPQDPAAPVKESE